MSAAWRKRAFTPVFDGLWRAPDFARAEQAERGAPLPALRRTALPDTEGQTAASAPK